MAAQSNVEGILKSEPAKIGTALAKGAEQDDLRQLLDSFFNDLSVAWESEQQEIITALRSMLEELTLAKDELLQIRPNAVSKQEIPQARDQLNAITQATELAANCILDAAEKLGDFSAADEAADKEALGEISTTLFEASTFQDICGQRITKVLGVFSKVELGLARVAELIGDTALVEEAPDEGVWDEDPDRLLEGPQLEGKGNDQEGIDALLASFD